MLASWEWVGGVAPAVILGARSAAHGATCAILSTISEIGSLRNPFLWFGTVNLPINIGRSKSAEKGDDSSI